MSSYQVDESARPPLPHPTKDVPFVTGSHAYGFPNERSDVDLVIPCTKDLRKFLETHAHDGREQDGVSDAFSILCGKLNIITPPNKKEYDFWRDGTIELCNRRPVSRVDAIEYLNQLREERGIYH